MNPWPVDLGGFDKFAAALLERVKAEGRFCMSAMLLNHWCGSPQPTGRVQAWCKANGLEVMPVNQFAGGWEFRPAGAEPDGGRLF